jgi:hypothetical protein
VVEGLRQLRSLGPGAGGVLNEDAVAAGRGELVDLEVGVLVGRRHPGVAEGLVQVEDGAKPSGGLVDETLIVRWVEDRRSGRFRAVGGTVSQTLGCGTQRHRPRNVAAFRWSLRPGSVVAPTAPGNSALLAGRHPPSLVGPGGRRDRGSFGLLTSGTSTVVSGCCDRCEDYSSSGPSTPSVLRGAGRPKIDSTINNPPIDG